MSVCGGRVLRVASVAIALVMASAGSAQARAPPATAGKAVSTKHQLTALRTASSRTYRQPDGSNVTQVSQATCPRRPSAACRVGILLATAAGEDRLDASCPQLVAPIDPSVNRLSGDHQSGRIPRSAILGVVAPHRDPAVAI
jgi:hypothetical protein